MSISSLPKRQAEDVARKVLGDQIRIARKCSDRAAQAAVRLDEPPEVVAQLLAATTALDGASEARA